MLSSHLFLCLPLFLPPCTVPCMIVLASPVEQVTCPYHCSFRLFTLVKTTFLTCQRGICENLEKNITIVLEECFWIVYRRGSTSTLDQMDGYLILHDSRVKTKIREILIRDMLFADDEAVATHTGQELQHLMNCFSHACKDFGLTISLKKTKGAVSWCRSFTSNNLHLIDNYELEFVHQFKMGSTISDNLSLDSEINKRIGKAASTFARRITRV